jgi:hypothetical protein
MARGGEMTNSDITNTDDTIIPTLAAELAAYEQHVKKGATKELLRSDLQGTITIIRDLMACMSKVSCALRSTSTRIKNTDGDAFVAAIIDNLSSELWRPNDDTD